MKRLSLLYIFAVICLAPVLLISPHALAQPRGPGSVEVSTEGPKGVSLRIGAQVRLIPTSESNWDFGMGDARVRANGTLATFADGTVLPAATLDYTRHANEGGNVGSNYIRGENRIYFLAKQENVWSFYLGTESDTTLENLSADRVSRGGTYGIERLNGAVNLPWINSWFHGGWDIYHVDIDAFGLIYGDDDPGFWLKGKKDKWAWQLGYHKKIDANDENTQLKSKSQDRDLYTLRIDYLPSKNHDIAGIYLYDDLQAFDWISARPMNGQNSRIGALYKGKLGPLSWFLEGVYQFGTIKKLPPESGLSGRKFDIRAYAGAANFVYDLSDKVGMGFKPHFALLYTSGDDNPRDSKVEGYTAAVAIQRFSTAFRGENTIPGDGNGVLGTSLYGWLPEYVGNQSPFLISGGVFTTARADNPGLTALQVGFDMTPFKKWLFRSELAYLRWNEKWAPGANKELGFEWDNELTWNLNNVVQFKGQVAAFFPGKGIKDRTDFLKDGVLNGLGGTRKAATRLGLEFIWVF